MPISPPLQFPSHHPLLTLNQLMLLVHALLVFIPESCGMTNGAMPLLPYLMMLLATSLQLPAGSLTQEMSLLQPMPILPKYNFGTITVPVPVIMTTLLSDKLLSRAE